MFYIVQQRESMVGDMDVLTKMNAAPVTPELLEGAMAVVLPRFKSKGDRSAVVMRDVARFLKGTRRGDDMDLCMALCARILAFNRWVIANAQTVQIFTHDELLAAIATTPLIEVDDAVCFSDAQFVEYLQKSACPELKKAELAAEIVLDCAAQTAGYLLEDVCAAANRGEPEAKALLEQFQAAVDEEIIAWKAARAA